MLRLFTFPLPALVMPQLPTLVARVPAGGAWLHEIKFDGYRIAVAIAGDNVRITTRSGQDWTAKFPAIGRGA